MTSTPTVRTDEELQRDVLAELAWDAQVRSTDVGVSVTDGVVALTGFVDSYAKKWAVERAVHRVRGVRAIADDIEVKLTPGMTRTDGDIAMAAVRGLEWDAFVPAERLDVTVSNGWVMLRGEVEWSYQKRAAERVVRHLSGVRGVTNLIAVSARTRPPAGELRPDQIRGGIRAALARSAQTEPDLIDVEVEGTTVILTGTVRSWRARQDAERVAWSAPGVSGVLTNLDIAG